MLLITFIIFAISVFEFSIVSGRRYLNGNTEFAFDLYKEMSIAKEDGNLFMSPVSVSLALGLISLGARGNTWNEIRKSLKINTSSERDDGNKFFKKIRKRLTHSYYDIYIANNLFIDKTFDVRRKFLKRARRYYDADVEQLNFLDSANSTEHINKWVSKITKEKINHLINREDITSDTRLILANAIYFKAEWDQKFDGELTRPEAFFHSDGNNMSVPMMQLVRMKLPYAENQWSQIVELPFYKKKLSMVLIKPKNSTLKDFERRLTSDVLNNLILRDEFVTVSMPRFKISSENEIDGALKKMGISDLFDKNLSNLSGINKLEKLFVSKVMHKGVVEVNEEGSEAAAATGVLITTRSEKFSHRFVADRPFMFLIKDNKSDVILFVGRVVEPECA